MNHQKHVKSAMYCFEVFSILVVFLTTFPIIALGLLTLILEWVEAERGSLF